MECAEFYYHLQILKDCLQEKRVRIILFHPPYDEAQQKIIDSICRNSKQIIGQVKRNSPLKPALKEIGRLIKSHKEPFIAAEELQYVILGQQKVSTLF